jgi:hypothetical protein
MLLDFSVNQPLDNPATRVLIRACTVQGSGNVPRAVADMAAEAGTAATVANPKKDKSLYENSLETAPACSAAGTEAAADFQIFTLSANGTREGTSAGSHVDVAGLLGGMQKFFEEKDNCDENFLFARQDNLVASIFIGNNLGKATVESVLKALSSRLAKDAGKRTIAQLCGNGTLADGAFGIAIDTSGDLASVQKIAREWSHGECASDTKLKSSGPLEGVKIFKIKEEAGVVSGNASSNRSVSNNTLPKPTESKTPSFNGTAFNSTSLNSTRIPTSRIMRRNNLQKRALCRTHEVKDGQDCPKLASVCGVSPADFTKFNAWRPDMCSSLRIGDIVCCSAGDPPPKPEPPKKNADGTCAVHLIVKGDTCGSLATKFGVTEKDLDKWNKGRTWAWTDCPGMMEGYTMCLSEGLPPMPAPQDTVQCGPMVPNTQRPTDPNTSLADLNPCPLKACCSNWGFCGPFEEHCAINAPEGGGPGATKKGFQNTCISNCGQDIKQNSGAPASFSRIGYYESFNLDRECLHLHAKNANTDGSYTHMHWAFAEIDPKTWKPIIKDPHDQWKGFKALKVKRIVSFGGWAYSTEPATYDIIRQAIINNREAFASNLAQFVKDEGIDGIDIDWEYPGVSFPIQ